MPKGKIKEDLKMGNLVKNSGATLSKYPSLFDDFFTKNWLFNPSADFVQNKFVPAVNVKETDDGFELEVAAPGLSKEDFNLELNNDTLVISAKRKEEKEVDEGKYSRREFNFQSFKRTFVVDKKLINGEKISARYEDGVLHVNLPKAEEAKVKPPKQIEVS